MKGPESFRRAAFRALGTTFAALAAARAFAAAPPPAKPAEGGGEIRAEEHVLSNGMRLLLVPRHDEPTVAGGWVAHVGSANERPGITGISHLFEHMMFKGTPRVGLKEPEKNYKKDVEILAEQEKLRDQMRAEESKLRAAYRRGEIDDPTKPENKSQTYRELEKKFDDLVKSERDIMEKNEYDRIYTKEGGSNENAFTNNDMTVYFIAVPKNRLELWFWMEADRLMSPVFREFYSERDVVFEERRMRTESTPTGRLEEAFDEMFWHGFPYTWPVVGYPSDIPAITKPQADEYFSLFYAPNNITTVLVGDFDPKEALRLAEKYFGRIPRGKNPPPEMTVLPPKWEAEMRFHGEADTNPEVEIVWHTVAFQHKDAYALQVLAQLLNGRTGRLFKSLVDAKPAEKNVASQISAFQNSQKYAGSFGIDGEVKDGKTPEELEKGIDAEVEKLKTDLVPDRELQKVKNAFNAGSYRRLSNNFSMMVQLLVNDGLGDWHELNEGPKKIQAVTAEDVRRVAKTYLTKENRGVAVFTRKAGAAASADDAALADVPNEMKPMIKQSLAKIGAETDAAKLQGMVTRLEGQAGQAPPEMKKALDLMLTKARARLAELSQGASKEKK